MRMYWLVALILAVNAIGIAGPCICVTGCLHDGPSATASDCCSGAAPDDISLRGDCCRDDGPQVLSATLDGSSLRFGFSDAIVLPARTPRAVQAGFVEVLTADRELPPKPLLRGHLPCLRAPPLASSV